MNVFTLGQNYFLPSIRLLDFIRLVSWNETQPLCWVSSLNPSYRFSNLGQKESLPRDEMLHLYHNPI